MKQRIVLAFSITGLLSLIAIIGLGIYQQGHAQTKVSLSTQVSPLPAIIVQSWATCASPCTGLMLATLQVNGVSGSYFVVPSGPTVSNQWVPQSVTIQGGTGITCAQVKP
jgi:hypothetical protein